MFKHLLVPLDGSAHAELALPVAARIAHVCGSRLLILRVVSPLGAGAETLDPALRMPSLREDALSYLAQVASSGLLAGISVETLVLEGAADEVIVEAVRERQVDLVILLSHARRRRAHWLIGSVAKGVIRDATAPVLLLREAARPKTRSRWSDIPPDRTVEILIPLDGSPLAEAVLAPALALVRALAGSQRAEVHLVHVVQMLPLGFSSTSPQTPATASGGGAVPAAEDYLRAVANRLQAQVSAETGAAHTVHISWSAPLETDVAHAVILLAERGQSLHHAFDLIAMSTHGAGGWERRVLGGVTEQVLSGTRQAVLVVRPGSLAKP
jgi:nucleotide-binding universal stress UspA family protein